MNKLFYCHRCYDICSLSENKRECAKCFSEFVQEIQEELDEIEEDGGSIPEPESSGLAKILLTNVEQPKPVPALSNNPYSVISIPFNISSSPIKPVPLSNSPGKQVEAVKTISNAVQNYNTEKSQISELSVQKDSRRNLKEQDNSVDNNRSMLRNEDDDSSSNYQSLSAPSPRSVLQ